MPELFQLDLSRITILLLFVLPAFINLMIFAYACFYLPQNRINYTFSVFVSLLGLWQLSDGLVHLSRTEATAETWYTISGILSLYIVPLGLAFTTELAGCRRPRRTLRFLLLFFPSLVLSTFILGRLDSYNIQPSGEWYWVVTPEPNIFSFMIYAWVSGLALLMIGLLLRFYLKAPRGSRSRSQFLLLYSGLVIPVIGGIITEVIGPLVFHKEDIPVTTPLLTGFSLAALIGMKKHHLLSFSPRTQWKNITEAMSEGLLIVDNEDRIMYANSAFCKMLGYEFSEIKNKVAFDLFLEGAEDRDKIMEVIRQRKNKISSKYQIQLRAKSGEMIWMETAGSPYLDSKGKVIGSIGIHTSIGELRSRTLELEKNEKLLREAQTIAHLGNWEADLRNQSSTWSDEIYQILGLKKEDLTPSIESFLSFVHPADLAYVKEIIEHGRKTSQSYSYQCRIITAAGILRYIYSDCRFILDREGRPSRIHGIIHDITERKQAEEELRHREAGLEEAQALAHVGSWELDFNTGVAIWSAEACTIYGLSPSENRQNFEAWISFIHPDDLEEVNADIEASRASLSESSMYHRIIRRDGTIRHIHSISRFDLDAQGKPIGLHGTCHDVTETKLLEQGLKAANLELETLVYKLSHDLRSPLTSIRGLVGVAGMQEERPENMELIRSIGEVASNMDELLIKLVRVMSVRDKKNNFTPINLTELLNGVLDALRFNENFNKVNINIINNVNDPLVSDREVLFSVFLNLVENAIKYHDYSKEQPEINIRIYKNGTPHIHIDVADNGMGIPEDSKAKVFDMFYRATSQAKGTGLGLFITQSSIKKLGGNIRLESELGKGTVFKVSLPDSTLS